MKHRRSLWNPRPGYRAKKAHPLSGSTLLLWLLLGLISDTASYARPKTDLVFLRNGDRVTCEIRRLNRGKLEVKTSDMGTIEIKWDKIARLWSEHFFVVELESGRRFFGAIDHLEDENKLVVGQSEQLTALELREVVDIAPVDASVWQGLAGSVDLGYGFTQAETATEWNGNAAVEYRARDYFGTADVSSHLKKQEGATDVTRNSLRASLARYFGTRHIALGLLRFEQNSSQDLTLRSTVGGGLGHAFVRTNNVAFGAVAGLVMATEKFVEGDFQESAEAMAGIQFELFRFDYPSMDVSTSLFAFPSLTVDGRVRLELDGKLRFEILKDFFWSLNFYDSFDSDPFGESAKRNDFGISTSLGWKF